MISEFKTSVSAAARVLRAVPLLLGAALVFTTAGSVCAAAAEPVASATTERVFPGKQWQVWDNPADAGFSAEQLARAGKLAEELNTESVVVIADGKVVWHWGDPTVKYNSHSIRKSMLSALYGKYVRNGVIDMEATMGDLGIDDRQGLSAEEKKATVRDLLKARSGVYHPALYESETMKRRKPARHSVAAGTHWCYSNWDFNVLGTIFEDKTGQGIFEAIETDIAGPIGMEDYTAADGTYITGAESEHRAYPFRISARDLARFGWLMLNQGNWDGTQVVDAEWVDESTRYHSDATLFGADGYGYMWWVARDFNKYPHLRGVTLPEGSYSAQGSGGHYLVVIPEYDLVVVHRVNTDIRGNRVTGRQFGKLLGEILAARTAEPADAAAPAGR